MSYTRWFLSIEIRSQFNEFINTIATYGRIGRLVNKLNLLYQNGELVRTEKNNRHKFSTFAEHVPQVRNLNNILHSIELLLQLTAIINQRLPNLAGTFHCGSVEMTSSVLVIYAHSNAGFYKLNQSINLIQDALADEYYSFSQILLKTSPRAQERKVKKKTVALGPEEQTMLAKFAEAIGRPDLLVKPAVVEPVIPEEDWEITL